MIIKTNWKLNTNNDFELINIVNQANNAVFTMTDLLIADNVYYVDNLARFGVYFMQFLLKNGYKSVTKLEELTTNTFFTTMHHGECNGFYVKTNDLIRFINFDKKFGVEFADYDQNKMLVDYAEETHRTGNSLGADAYNEFAITIWGVKKDNVINRQLMRRDYPIINNDTLNLAKRYTSGLQLFCKGKYTNVYHYDQQSAYPAQLLNNTPIGAPIKSYKNIENIPKLYWYVVKFAFFNLKLKHGIEWLGLNKTFGFLSLTKELYELFLSTYSADIVIKDIVVFKTRKDHFKRFITKNIIDGKIYAKNRIIAKYNKYIANSLIGYFGRNIVTNTNKFTWNKGKCSVKTIKSKIDPIYLPVYLYVQGKQKAEFIKTLNRIDGVIYANTDGFFTTKPLNIDLLNSRFTTDLGAYKHKCTYAELYINSINGYAGITTDGEVDNCLAGMSMAMLIDPTQYEQQQFTYHTDITTEHLTIHRVYVTPQPIHQRN